MRHAKFGKHRLLPLHPTAVTAVQGYRRLRDQAFPHPASPALLVSSTGTRLLYYNVSQTFTKLARRAGLAARSGRCRPRPHDLRHSFAVATLLDWCRDGGDVASRMPLLSAYLGHTEPANTYWYLHSRPGTARRGRPPSRRPARRPPVTAIAATLQAFFTERLISQRRASPHTDHRLPRHAAAAGRLRRDSAPGPRPAAWTSPTWTPR